MRDQLTLFETEEIDEAELDRPIAVTLGTRSGNFYLRRKRKEAVGRFLEILKELSGKDIYIGSYDQGGRHYWTNNLKLARLQVETPGMFLARKDGQIPPVIVLWGNRDASVRIFTNFLTNVRIQEYQGYTHYLVDFRNGFPDHPIDQWKDHYNCLQITRFHD